MAIAEADINALIIDITQPYGSGDEFLLERLRGSEVPCLLLVNKIDLLPKKEVMERLLQWQSVYPFDEIIPLSALKQENLNELLSVIRSYLKEGVAYFPQEMVSDHGENFRIAEIIRGLVLEGGGMRGSYTCGVLDAFLDHHIEFNGVIGVSAGY